MASIFLSYARDDAAKAAKIAAALEAAGHNVWWDKHIGAGSRFGAEIEEALEAADRVVVLWSKNSVRSAWVLDEAAAGRDSGRLLPVLIEKVKPPLGFRQFQSIDLTRARRGEAALAPLFEAVGTDGKDKPPSSPRPARARTVPWKSLAIAVALLITIGACWWLINRASSSGDALSVSVAAGSSDPRSAELARSIALDLGQYRAGPLGSMTILDSADNSGGANYMVDISASGDSTGLHADIAMRSREAKGLLWSTTIEGNGLRMVDLRQQTAAKLGRVLNCLVDIQRSANRPRHEVLGLYLAGCSADVDSDEAISILRSVTAKVPDFAPGWAGLAYLETDSFSYPAQDNQTDLRRAAIEHLAQARRLDPQIAEGYAAEANLVLNGRSAATDVLKVLDRGLEAHPDSALLHGQKSALLQSVGRMNDSVVEAEQAVEFNPLAPGVRGDLISALAFAGRTKEAFDLLDQADKIWPGSNSFANIRYILNLRFGDPAAALKYLRDQGTGTAANPATDEAWVAFLEARMDPTPVKIGKALDAFRARDLHQTVPITGFVQALGTFGRVDEFFAVTARPDLLDLLRAGSDVLFRAHMKSVRNDPRFLALADRIGLIDYWQRSGHWPDYCSEPRLPYNCKAEAAKLNGRNPPSG